MSEEKEVIKETVAPSVNEQPPVEAKEITDDEKKETRGRHKKDCACPVCKQRRKKEANTEKEAIEKTQTNVKGGKEDLDKFMNDYAEAGVAGQAQPAAQPTTPPKVLISGYLLLIVLDVLFPNIIKFVLSKFAPKYKKLNTSKIRLTKEEKEELEDSADEVAKILTQNANPIVVFFVSLSFMYTSKILDYDLPEENRFKPKKKEVKK